MGLPTSTLSPSRQLCIEHRSNLLKKENQILLLPLTSSLMPFPSNSPEVQHSYHTYRALPDLVPAQVSSSTSFSLSPALPALATSSLPAL